MFGSTHIIKNNLHFINDKLYVDLETGLVYTPYTINTSDYITINENDINPFVGISSRGLSTLNNSYYITTGIDTISNNRMYSNVTIDGDLHIEGNLYLTGKLYINGVERHYINP